MNAPNYELALYYRCPQSLLPFLPSGPTLRRRGFFRLGDGITCYGRLTSADGGAKPHGELADALQFVEIESSSVRLPFDPGEIIENLRRERYSAHFREEGNILNAALRKVYYLLRPYLSVSVRRHLQKLRLGDWKQIRFPAWPVDFTVDRIHQKLLALAMQAQKIESVPFIWFWPEGFETCAIMTHDVEEASGREFCAELMDLDESFGIRSAFQLVPEDRYPVPKSLVETIVSRGFEVNVHDLKHDGRLFADHKEFLRRAQRINKYVREFGAEGFRSGVLYRNADWYDAFDFSYDMSIPNVGHLDSQRGGCCTIMPYFIGKIVELPVTCVQDYTLFHILGDFTIDLWKAQISLIMENHGLISIIVHPDYIDEPKAKQTYHALLTHLTALREKRKVWTPLPRDVANWWRQRSQLNLVAEGSGWRVEGPGKERARVGFAKLNGNGVTYSLSA